MVYSVTYSGAFGFEAPLRHFDNHDEAHDSAKQWVQDAEPTPELKDRRFYGPMRRASLFGPDGLMAMFYREPRYRKREARKYPGVSAVGQGTLRMIFPKTKSRVQLVQGLTEAREREQEHLALKRSRAKPGKKRADMRGEPTLFDAV